MDISNEKKQSIGGLRIRNQSDISTALTCAFCKFLLFIPIQLKCCGIRLCRWCSKNGLSNSKPFHCPYCDTEQPEKEALSDRGAERDLNAIKIECYSCPWTGSYKDYQEHLQQEHADLECPDCPARFFTINSFEEHRQEICQNRSSPCGVPGCNELVKRSDMQTHCLNITHQILLVKFIINYIIHNKHLFKKSNYSTSKASIYRYIKQEMEAGLESIKMLAPGLAILTNDGTRLRSEHDQSKSVCDRIIVQINETKKSFNEDNEILLKCTQSHDATVKEMEESKILYSSTKISILDDGGSIIFSFHRHHDEINSTFSIVTAKCKTSPHGYLFTVRVCATIDPENENQGYLSVYIRLLCSDFDPILLYPFPYNISFTLCDQSGKGKDITSTIIPDRNSPSFARPTSEQNDEIGIMKFCSLKHLTDVNSVYLKDSTFFIRTTINFMNTDSVPVP